MAVSGCDPSAPLTRLPPLRCRGRLSGFDAWPSVHLDVPARSAQGLWREFKVGLATVVRAFRQPGGCRLRAGEDGLAIALWTNLHGIAAVQANRSFRLIGPGVDIEALVAGRKRRIWHEEVTQRLSLRTVSYAVARPRRRSGSSSSKRPTSEARRQPSVTNVVRRGLGSVDKGTAGEVEDRAGHGACSVRRGIHRRLGDLREAGESPEAGVADQ